MFSFIFMENLLTIGSLKFFSGQNNFISLKTGVAFFKIIKYFYNNIYGYQNRLITSNILHNIMVYKKHIEKL